MEYKKLTSDNFPSCLTKIVIVLGLVLSVFMWLILFFCLYKLNNEITLLKAQQEELMNKISTPEFNTGSTPEDIYDYYEYLSTSDEDEDNDFNEDSPKVDKTHNLALNNLMLGGSHTKDGLETRRLKRDIIGMTVDGVPVNSESYAEVKRKNRTRVKQAHYKSQSSSREEIDAPATTGSSTSAVSTEKINTAPTSPVVYSRSRVMHNTKPRPRRRYLKRPMLRSFDSKSPDQSVSPDMTVVQVIPHRKRHRQRRVGSSSMLRPTIHMNGEALSSVSSNDDHYLGNGRMHHYSNHFKNWTKDNWVQNLGMDDYFQLSDGYLKFLESGLYYVYAQIYYVDEHDTNGFGVYKNDELVLQCTTTSHTNHRVLKPNTCYTGGVIAFSNGDTLKVHDIEANRYSIFQKGKSFFGAMKLGEIRET